MFSDNDESETKNSTHSSTQRDVYYVPNTLSREEQFDRYPFIDTAQLVRKVNDLLDTSSISKQLFAKRIVGMTQSCVSHMLLRPKPWMTLQPNGREPYVRMQMFVDKPVNAINQLMAEQSNVSMADVQQPRTTLVVEDDRDDDDDEQYES